MDPIWTHTGPYGPKMGPYGPIWAHGPGPMGPWARGWRAPPPHHDPHHGDPRTPPRIPPSNPGPIWLQVHIILCPIPIFSYARSPYFPMPDPHIFLCPIPIFSYALSPAYTPYLHPTPIVSSNSNSFFQLPIPIFSYARSSYFPMPDPHIFLCPIPIFRNQHFQNGATSVMINIFVMTAPF